MNQNRPSVSVLMPCFNEEKSIGVAIESILNQTYQNIELIIVDDNSTDRTIELAQKYALKDNRISIITKDKNLPRRPGISRNIGTTLAQGEYIIFMDADDYSKPDRIEKQL